MYRRWAQLLTEVEVWAVNYPGRETLHSLPFAKTTAEIVELILEQTSFWNEKPVLVYGHSFGALMAFTTAVALQKKTIVPLSVMVSARRAPHLDAAETFGDLSDDQFVAQLDRFGGVPAAIRQDPEMMAFYAPIIRADLQLNDSSKTTVDEVIDAPLYLFSARYDKVADEAELLAWRSVTRGHFTHRVFEGGHFFIQDDAEGFTACIRSIIHTLLQQNDEELIAF